MPNSSESSPQGKRNKPMLLAAMRGNFGRWVYYVALMPVVEVARRVNFAEEIHKNKSLADMIQREIRHERGKEVARYLKEVDERFFNSLVVAVYRGRPRWYQMALRNDGAADLTAGDLPVPVSGSIGVLSLSGSERLFALDGQHRLAGIREALEAGVLRPDEEISLVCVAHQPTSAGMQRTRRLFTTLNKTARPVGKGNIIALDEDDPVAICTRRLVDEYPWFEGRRIAFKATNTIAPSDAEAFTTIGAVNDVLRSIFRALYPEVLKLYKVSRPPDEQLATLQGAATSFFETLRQNVPEVKEYARSTRPQVVIARYRGTAQHLLFRPIGLTVFAEVASRLARVHGLVNAVCLMSQLPLNLDDAPYRSILWDPDRRRMLHRNSKLVRDLLLYMVRLGDSKGLQQEVRRLSGHRGFLVSELPRIQR